MQDEEQRPVAQNVLAFVLDQTLRLFHPFVPFITEGIFQKLNEIAPTCGLTGLAETASSDALVIAAWPNRIDALIDEQTEKDIMRIQDVIRAIRDVRSKYGVHPKRRIDVTARASYEIIISLNRNRDLIKKLAVLSDFQADTNLTKASNAVAVITNDIEIFVSGAIDPKVERRRLEEQKQEVARAKKAVEAKLNNENFVAKAKPQVVAQARDRLAELAEQLKTVEKHLSEL